jgi:hypothetical protein
MTKHHQVSWEESCHMIWALSNLSSKHVDRWSCQNVCLTSWQVAALEKLVNMKVLDTYWGILELQKCRECSAFNIIKIIQLYDLRFTSSHCKCSYAGSDLHWSWEEQLWEEQPHERNNLILSSCDIPSMMVGVWVGFRYSCIYNLILSSFTMWGQECSGRPIFSELSG